jgi:nucleoside-diphosphate-sugar epimerase
MWARRPDVILVTGASGFVGRRVCAALAARGKRVVGLDREGPVALGDKPSYPSIECDVRDSDQIEHVFHQWPFAAVVHLASLLKTASQQRPLDALQVNVQGSLNVLGAALAFQVPRVIYASSISVYGSRPAGGTKGVSEVASATPEDVYGATKRYVEIVGEEHRQRFGIEFVAVRIATVLGPGAHSTSSPWRSEIFEKMGGREPVRVAVPYRCDEALPLVHVDDVAESVARLVDVERISSAVYNAPCETWQISDLAALIESLDGNLKITFGESAVTGIPRAIDSRRFVTEFGFSPVPLKDRLRRAAQTNVPTVSCSDAQNRGNAKSPVN